MSLAIEYAAAAVVLVVSNLFPLPWRMPARPFQG